MRVFVTGATGFIGSAVVRELIEGGHTVTGLARTDAAAKSLEARGARAHRGALTDLKALRKAAGASDGVIHLGFIHAIAQMTPGQRLGVFLGGAPTGIPDRYLGVLTGTDSGAIDAIGAALEASGRPLVTTFATMAMAPGRVATEDDKPDPRSPGHGRALAEKTVKDWASRGVRASIIRLPPSVHGDGDTGFVPRLIAVARKKRVAAYVGDGSNHWPAVHRLDAARLFRLALEAGTAGAVYHGVAEQGVPFRQIAEVIGRHLNVPVKSKSAKWASSQLGWVAPFVGYDNLVSSELTQVQLGWRPQQPGLLADLDRPSYFAI